MPEPSTILLIGASRGLGHAMAAEFVKRGWNVVGTVRPGGSRTKLHDLADASGGQVEIEILDIGPDGRLSFEESVPRVVDVLLAKQGRPGLEYLDYLGRVVAW